MMSFWHVPRTEDTRLEHTRESSDIPRDAPCWVGHGAKFIGSSRMNLRAALNRLITREQFMPSPWGMFVNPFYFARRGLHEELRRARPHVRGRVLDVGCGTKPYQSLFDVAEYVGLEIEDPTGSVSAADVLYDGSSFPFEDDSFDSVLTCQVFEHVFQPEAFLNEVRRVLKPGGTLVMTVPFVWDEHEQPRDYARYSSFGLRHLLESHGFTVVSSRKSMGDVRTLVQLAAGYLYKVSPFTSSGGSMALAFNLLSATTFNLTGAFLREILPANEDLYLDNVVVAGKAGSDVMLD